MKKLLITALAWFGALLIAQQAPAQSPASAPSAPPAVTQRLRATVQSFDGSTLVLKERSGEVVSLALADNFSVNEVLPVELSAIQPGSYVGAATMPQTDGSLQAIEVLVFPEAARGSGEGHYPWDLQPGSMMTNATVGDMASTPQGRTLKLRYKGGERSIVVPTGTPVVTFKPADRTLLVPGAKVMVTAQVRDGKPTALRALAGRNGFTPPM
ncbi:MAG TPA: hypothetical protein VHQ87_15265 [Rhizobacter sp.]|nr:hypothetical protein [Rhizobacter sp.]